MPATDSLAIRRVPLVSVVMGVGLVVGFLVPVVFEWMEQPWNRNRLPGMEWAALVSVVVACGLGVLEYWHGRRFEGQLNAAAADERPRRMQFKLWQLFVAMTVAAIVLAVLKWLDLFWTSAVVGVVVGGVLGWGLFQGPRVQLRAAALVAALYCPLVWMIAFNVPIGRTSGLISAIPFAPAILPAALIRAVTYRGGPDEMGVVAGGIVIAELLLGAWLARRGGKLYAAYLIVVLLVTCVSSFGMHALYRA